ncbi:class I SAM-dependent methyltransferase [Staphylococcus condimenti]|uniref:Class I SAM-dependent methyltransferase n=3 Tax=Staphylococcus condimenti TaxID=70255 RepID=A0A143P859_9STAP|nr:MULTISPECIES: class I SAM-dependent methyltransferase [Staphylococcus]AMY04647.1 methyltransferase [Staphylococcus condimenti]APR60885.1 SAM-dependent methyltransferase [Staphylococcus condimenti]MDK8644664.1 class I SAM-dependent methyltransferase [Staphylococcus condimenti]OFO99028.1 methyltransferase [Staphylococcus sp. HMSC065E08]QQS83549.1 class I SAM-dependent methyltransferase [Staphylococcus condimenti]
MEQYHDFSQYYDELTLDQPYESWLEIVKSTVKNNSSILDLGCGTGSLTHQLTELGPVTGMDLSPDMLVMASQKSDEVRWLEGDMSNFNLKEKFDVVTIFCDSLNYLNSYNAVVDTFKQVYNHLNEDGFFLFDVHTVYKMNTLFNNQSYIDETEHVFLGWDAIAGDEPNSVWHYMTFFEKQKDGSYRRFDEEHYQKTYDENEYKNMLEQVGFQNITTFYDFDSNNHNPESDRLFFIVKK